MQKKGIDLLVSHDPANMNYLTGYDAWSFYYAQCVLVHVNEDEPICFVRAQDGGGAYIKTYLQDKNIIEVADALTDILVVTYGAGAAFGINLDKCFEEVHKSNMSKLGENGKPIFNELGKVMKGPNYHKPNLKQFV